MNIYGYLRTQKQSEEEKFELFKKNIWKIYLWLGFNLILGIVFSALFVTYFNELSHYISFVNAHDKEWIKKNETFLNKQVNYNTSLLVSFVVFWVVFISSDLWFYFWFNKQDVIYYRNNKKIFIILNILIYTNLFLPFVCLATFGLTSYGVIYKLKNFQKNNNI